MSKKIYVIQKHQAKKLHYDLRLEMNGVLKSWAIPKEPLNRKGIKRLAIQVEDHDLEYANFEGTIPEGFYGAGKVEIWDKGSYEVEEMEEGKIVFKVDGSKLKGRFCLIKLKKGKNYWIFFKI